MGQSDRARGRRIRQAALALLCVTVASAVPVAASARTRPITFSLELGYWCVSGRASDSVRVGVTWLDDAGVVKLRGTVRTTATGRWSLCGDAQEDIEAGDVVTARVGLTSRSVTVPSLRVDPDRHGTERSTIHGPANTPLLLTICERRSGEPLRYWARVCPLGSSSVTTDADGLFTFGPWDLMRGGDSVIATLKTESGDTFTRAQTVPYIDVLVGRDRFLGKTVPFRRVEVELWRSGTLTGTWAGRADAWQWGGLGGFFGRFRDDANEVVRVRVGDRIISPQVGPEGGFLVPAVFLTANARTDAIAGSCGTGPWLAGLSVATPGTSRSYRDGFRPNAGGGFSTDITRWFDVRSGDVVTIHCVLLSGDEVSRRLVVS